ncbi:MAG: DNA polymerase III subunit delta' [Sarcina sp.]
MVDIIGHKKILDRFKNSKSKNALSHAHLIIGDDGIGKSLVAKELAKIILNIDKEKNHIDIVDYKTQEASFKISNVRDIISEVNKKPYEGSQKVIIIYNGEKMTIEAQNALLKTIEEPPKGVYIIILSNNLDLMLETIKSRCQITKLLPLNDDELLEFINKKYKDVDKASKSTFIAFSQGIPGRIDKLAKDTSFFIIRNFVLDLLLTIANRNINNVVLYTTYFDSKAKNEISKALMGKNIELLEQIISFTRDVIICKEVANDGFIINRDKLEEIKKLASLMSYKKLNNFINIVDRTRENLKSNTNRVLTFNEMMRKMLEA